ncbi:MAG: hypothetical protein AAFU85_13475 [Planctomycetota bacterium]
MASLRRETDRNRTGWRLQFRESGNRRSLWLGDIAKRQAETIARHVDNLCLAKETATQAPTETLKWEASLTGRIRKTLEKWALIEPAVVSARKLADFVQCYIDSRTDVKDATREKYGHTKRMLVTYFGEDRPITSITKADCQLWHRSMLKTHAETTAGKHIKRARTVFRFAVDARVIPINPLEGIKVGDEVSKERDHYVTRDDAARILADCDPEQALAFAFARFAGLRPCEFLSIRWSDLQGDRIRVDSIKTGLRWVPIFKEVRDALAAFETPDPNARILRRWSPDANLATNLNRVIERAGVKTWPKLFVNCRASCRVDLEEHFPAWVCDSWMGHGVQIAEKHYRRMHDEYFDRAVSLAVTSVPVSDTAMTPR